MIIIKASDSTSEMREWFDKRTKTHIKMVQRYCKKIYDYDPKRFANLIERGEKHDQSKFGKPEYDPYVWTTWRYKCEEDGLDFSPPDGMEDMMHEATEHHVKNNPHHPECHCGRTENLINEENRDKPPEESVDATKMKDEDIAEMVADWCAAGEERGNTPKSWADKNVGTRWMFTDEQKDLIYELIKVAWD